jgi:hypothetical protein
VTNSAWNSDKAVATITTPPYQKDGDATATFTAKERAEIVAIWRAVSDAFGAFDVDVTTQQPAGVLGSWGTWVCIGGSSKDWLCPTAANGCAGGIAYTPGFGEPQYQPAFVFQQGAVSAVWKAAIHEGEFLFMWVRERARQCVSVCSRERARASVERERDHIYTCTPPYQNKH